MYLWDYVKKEIIPATISTFSHERARAGPISTVALIAIEEHESRLGRIIARPTIV